MPWRLSTGLEIGSTRPEVGENTSSLLFLVLSREKNISYNDGGLEKGKTMEFIIATVATIIVIAAFSKAAVEWAKLVDGDPFWTTSDLEEWKW